MRELVADVIVVGGGGSGLAAAAEASHSGGRVIVLEKQHQLGGTTALAVGSIMASETDLQKQLNVKDNPADHAADLEQIAKNFAREVSTMVYKIIALFFSFASSIIFAT